MAIKPSGFDDGYEEFNGTKLPDGYLIRKPRRPKKRKIPDWVFDKKKTHNKIYKQAKQDEEVARLYWRVGWTAKEIAEEILGSTQKFRVIESILYRLKNM